MKRLILGTALTLGLLGTSALAQGYEVPPSSSTYSSVPVISDEAMEACVILYNKGKWLGEKINKIQVDRYSQSSIDTYNNKVNQHSSMISDFNRNCAGKQSQSAYEATQRLNNQNKS